MYVQEAAAVEASSKEDCSASGVAEAAGCDEADDAFALVLGELAAHHRQLRFV
jgi:hypothetical protein